MLNTHKSRQNEPNETPCSPLSSPGNPETMASPPHSQPTPTPTPSPYMDLRTLLAAAEGPSWPLQAHSLLEVRKDEVPALLHSKLLVSLCSLSQV